MQTRLTSVLLVPSWVHASAARGRQLAHQVINLGLIVTSALMYGFAPLARWVLTCCAVNVLALSGQSEKQPPAPRQL